MTWRRAQGDASRRPYWNRLPSFEQAHEEDMVSSALCLMLIRNSCL